MNTPPRIGIAVNELSGDQLASALIRALQAQRPDIRFEGMTGPGMEFLGCRPLFRMDPVMGLVEILKHLPYLLGIRRGLYRHFIAHPPDLFIGVDAPDFNLPLERRLKAAGIKTAHFVCPTVWAWRPGRAKKFSRTIDLMLCLFPFEPQFLSAYRVPAVFVGHPLADEIPLQPLEAPEQRAELGMDPQRPAIALLPGSRMSEVNRLTDDFIRTARWCRERQPELQFVLPLVNAEIRSFVTSRLQALEPDLPVTLLDGRSRQALQAAEVVLAASGTATLEALLYKRPMVVAYRVNAITYGLVRFFKLVKVSHVAMANLVSDKPLAPEFIQEHCRHELMGPELLDMLNNDTRRAEIEAHYKRTHEQMRCNAAQQAVEAVLRMLEDA